MQVTPRTVQKCISMLDDVGFVRRIERLTGLIQRATPLAVEAVRERNKVRRMLERLGRKKPRVDATDPDEKVP